MGNRITFKVFNRTTGEDVTDRENWFIDTNGDLYFEIEDVDSPVAVAAAEDYCYQASIHFN